MSREKQIIFISHIHEDSKIAIALSNWIEKHYLGFFNVFVSSDGASIKAGDNWSTVLELSLKNADLMFVIITQESLNKKWINFEVGGAYFLEKRIVPICCKKLKIKDIDTPLSWLQAIEGWDPSQAKKIPEIISESFNIKCPNIDIKQIVDICNGNFSRSVQINLSDLNIQERIIPLFFLIETSGSMAGVLIKMVQHGLEILLNELQNLSGATPMLCIIGYDSRAHILLPPTPVSKINDLPILYASGTSSLGEALSLLANLLRNSSNIPENSYSPIITFLLDGNPTDNFEKGIQDLKSIPIIKKSIKIGIANSWLVDIKILEIIGSTHIIQLNTTKDLFRFFRWLSSSLVDNIIMGNKEIDLLPLPNSLKPKI
ncbi:MAG: TIR domain-containing protein [Candidatus Hodarchaeota archaeon]